MKIQFKPFRIYVEKYHIQDGNIYPPRILNLKRVGLILLAIIAIVTAICVYTHRNDSEVAITDVTIEHKIVNPSYIGTLTTNLNGIRIIPADSVEGRPTFDVVIEDEKVLESMYAEEIAYSLIHNKWEYNEDLTLDSLTTK